MVQQARQLVYDALPHNIEQPFRVQDIRLGSVLDYGADEFMGGQACWAQLVAPWVSDSTTLYDVGSVQFTIAEDVARPDSYIVQVRLATQRFHWWTE